MVWIWRVDPPPRDAAGAAARAPACAPPPCPRLNFGPGRPPEVADCDDVSAAVSAQQEMLSASPLPARRKWGSLLLAAGRDLVSGLTASTPVAQGLRVQGLAGRKAGVSTGRGLPSLGTPSIRRGSRKEALGAE